MPRLLRHPRVHPDSRSGRRSPISRDEVSGCGVQDTKEQVMTSARLFQLRSARSKRCAIVTMLALVVSPMAPPFLTPTVRAQAQVAGVGSGFTIDAEDIRFIYRQILVAQDHAAGHPLLGPG